MKKIILAAVAGVISVTLVTAVTVFLIGCRASASVPSLELRNAETGKLIASYPFSDTDTFSVTFIHSVNQSEVVDFYKRGDDGQLMIYATLYHAYGAGIPESWPDDAVVTTSKDGIYVSGLHMTYDHVRYIVGTVSDHILKINDGEEISLRTLCGKNAEVEFSLTPGK